MRITRIEIEKYKSIKEPIEINFYDDLPTVLIGKNGSGKTNILEALNAITEANSNYFGLNKEIPLSYKVLICLSKDDITRLFPGKNIDENKCRFIACSGENCKIDRIESEYLVPLLNSEICEIHDLAGELMENKIIDEKHGFRFSCSWGTVYGEHFLEEGYPRMLPGDRENGLPMERSTSHTSSSSAIAKERTVFQKSFRRRQSLSTGFILDSWRG